MCFNAQHTLYNLAEPTTIFVTGYVTQGQL